MTRHDLMEEIFRLPLDERIDLVGDVWDGIAASPDDVPTPEWHLRTVEQRLASPRGRYLTWEEVRERLERGE